jgi:hypothetical protein
MVSPLRSGRTWAQMLSRTRAPQSLSLLVAMPAEDCPRPLARFLFWCRWRRCRPIRFMPEIAPMLTTTLPIIGSAKVMISSRPDAMQLKRARWPHLFAPAALRRLSKISAPSRCARWAPRARRLPRASLYFGPRVVTGNRRRRVRRPAAIRAGRMRAPACAVCAGVRRGWRTARARALLGASLHFVFA